MYVADDSTALNTGVVECNGKFGMVASQIQIRFGVCGADAATTRHQTLVYLYCSAHSSLGELCHECLAGFFRDQEINTEHGRERTLVFGTRSCLEAPPETNSTNYGIYSGLCERHEKCHATA